MKIDFDYGDFSSLTDDTKSLDDKSIFLLTSQNKRYYEALPKKPVAITPSQLVSLWGLEALDVVGVTGTNGKTTVTAIIYSLMLDLGRKPALQGTRGFFANEERLEEKSMTTPSVLETLLHMKQALAKGCDCFIMEVSSHAIDQKRIEGITFALKVHTNVTADHLDYHKTIEEYRRVKSIFFADDSPKLLNKDDLAHITYNPTNAKSYGVDNMATYKVQAFSLNGGIHGLIKYLEEEATFSSPMVGLFNLYNLLAGVGAVSMLTQKPLQEICDALDNFGGVAGRMEVVSKEPLVIVDFAHTDDGMLQVLQSMKDKTLSVVFGAGGNRDRQKRPRMGAIAGRFATKIYVTSDNPRDEEPQVIIDEILSGLLGKENVRVFVDRKEAIKNAIEELKEGEALLILGKGDEDYQEIKGVKHHFDDREVVRELLG